MYNKSFYPTPVSIAQKMLEPFSGSELFERSILEPSAGKGDLCDAVSQKARGYYNSHTKVKIHCCEIEPELQATLNGKGYVLINADFLSFQPDEAYDLIIMNPPFSNAERHLLHAWDILPHGDIVCLLAANSINNPTTAE